jgi:A/G-specific adenine glycosylase
MDLGSSFCQAKTVHCDPCPITSDCKATLNDNPLEYPETKKSKSIPTINVAVCIISHNSKLLLMQRPQNKMLGGLWEFPGGKIKLGEPKENATTREVKEETGLTIKDPQYLGEVKHQYSHFKASISLFYYIIDDISSIKIKENYIWTTMKGLDKFPLPKANYKMLELLNKAI